jgi:hypothetical protein
VEANQGIRGMIGGAIVADRILHALQELRGHQRVDDRGQRSAGNPDVARQAPVR